MIHFATLLTQEQVERTHAASLEILEKVGLLVRNEKARDDLQTRRLPGGFRDADRKISTRGGREVPPDAAADLHLLRSRSAV